MATRAHLNDGEGMPVCGAASYESYTIVEEIHYVNCPACRKAFREATQAGRAVRSESSLLAARADAMARARLRLEQIEELVDKARDDLRLHIGAALASEEVSKHFDNLEQSANALLRYLQEFQP